MKEDWSDILNLGTKSPIKIHLIGVAGSGMSGIAGLLLSLGHTVSGSDKADTKETGGTVFGYQVADPERYGVVDFDTDGTVREIIEKPDVPPSNHAVTGLYFVDGTAPEKAKRVKPSARGELEITSLLEMYLKEGSLDVQRMGRGYAWLDTGTHGSLLDAGNFVRTIQKRQGQQIGCPEEIAYEMGFITREELMNQAEIYMKNDYGKYLKKL